LIGYLADEVNTGSVAVEPTAAGTHKAACQSAVAGGSTVAGGSAAGPMPVANCTTPGLSIRLSAVAGDMDTYEATFVAGPLAGKILRSKVSTLTDAKWDACIPTRHRWLASAVAGQFAEATPEERARATVHFLELACARQLLALPAVAGHASGTVEDPIGAAAANADAGGTAA